jgi:acylphosphatase
MVAKAQELGVTGWVRNCRNGSVEAIVSGTPEQVAAIMNWARQGPPGAQVDHVAVELARGEFADFTQAPGA